MTGLLWPLREVRTPHHTNTPQKQNGQKLGKVAHTCNPQKLGMVAHTCKPQPALQHVKQEDYRLFKVNLLQFRDQPA